jgi:hypothetical protein
LRVADANVNIGANVHVGLMGWSKLFGDPNAVPPVVPSIINFPIVLP